MSDLIPDVRKFAVLRANALGDFISALPVLEVHRAAYPRAEIALHGPAGWGVELTLPSAARGRVVACPVHGSRVLM
jgi:hypothetical protein